ncbi:MAG: hypothetical protein A2219_05200 [Elusimicrobia bacterium RIFOXYA2_FULL_50_26]|nr:MAG: hypothetical protein A2219_05200 [Elusimicrobia bacterium RIFOXYA2_FULL_50_26]
MSLKRILVVITDEETGKLAETTLQLDGYSVIRVTDALNALEYARLNKPDLVIVDIDMPRMEGLTLNRRIRHDREIHFVPIIMLTSARTHPEDRIAGLKLGADDYLLKPFVPQDLSIKVSRLIIRGEEHRAFSPLTRLPGNYALEAEITKRIESRKPFAACYFDLDDFRQFNDHYGYEQGDRVLRFLSMIISGAQNQWGNKGDFLAHLGGDDFVLVTAQDKVKAICDQVIHEFNHIIPDYYEEHDRKSGFITVLSRKGESRKFPLMTISVAVAPNENSSIKHYAQLLDILNEMKHYAKKQPGSVWVKDRRQQTITKE